MIRAIKDLWYLFGVWMIMRVNKISAGKLLEQWGQALQRNISHN